jgi:hypothetical protein
VAQNVRNLQREHELSLLNVDPFFEMQASSMGISRDVLTRFQIGKMRIAYAGNKWWPAPYNDFAALPALIMPTGFDGWVVRDLLATDGTRCWFRLGVDNWLGHPDEMPIHTSVGGYLKSGRGCVCLGFRRGEA